MHCAFLEEYLPDVDFAFIACAEHELSDILVAPDVDVLSKGRNRVSMGIGTVILGNGDGSLEFDVPEANRPVIMASHEQISPFEVEQTTYL